MDYPIRLAEQLTVHVRSLRKLRGLTQQELAKRLGVSQARIATIERTVGAVSAKQLFEVLRVLDATLVVRDERPRDQPAISPSPSEFRHSGPPADNADQW